jgi:DNA processing protein
LERSRRVSSLSPYPPEHVPLAREIASGRGAVVSEFPLDMPPRPYHFPRRNRLIAALAAAVVVVEAAEDSGSLITADHALDLGREVLGVPGRVDNPNSRGVHRLLREGAAVCESADDVLRALGLDPPQSPVVGSAASAADSRWGTNAAENALLEALAGTERHADELLEATGLAPADGLAALSALELRGAVTLGADGRYSVAVK